MSIENLVDRTSLPIPSPRNRARRIYSHQENFEHVPTTEGRPLWEAAAASAASHYGFERHTELQTQGADAFETALRNVGHLAKGPIDGHPSQAVICQELEAGRPVGARIQWSSGLPHFVIVHAYDQTPAGIQYTIDDPLYGVIRITGWSLTHSYLNDGVWSHYYLTE